MALSVRLDPRTERLVEQLARKRRQTKSEVIRDALGLLAERENGTAKKKRPYDLVAHVIGSVRWGPPDLSVRTVEKFARLLRDKRKKRG
jgi:Arc/MetJ-type ribon-helix-helix transcriptional regulator